MNMTRSCDSELPWGRASVRLPGADSALLKRTRFLWGSALFILLAHAASARAAELKLPVLWSVDLGTVMENAATVADLNGDGRDEVVVPGHEVIIVLDKDGKVLWRWHAKGRLMTYPTILTRGDKPPLIYTADNSGSFTCLDGTGKQVWQVRLKGSTSESAAVVADLDGDGAPEVVQTDRTGTVWAFAALTGKVIWKGTVKGIPVSPAVGDLDGDGKAEVVVATGEGIVAAIRHDGSPLWTREIGGTSPSWATAAPVIFVGSGGVVRIAVASSARRLYCLDAQGNTLWRRPTDGPVASSVSVGDLDLDGRADIFAVTQLGKVHRFDEDGRALWSIDMQGRSLAAGAIIDLNGDGRLEYALCTQRGRLLVLDDQGAFIFDHQFDTRTVNVTPTLGDVTPDSPGLEMVITGGESGRVICLGTQAPVDALAQWTAYRGDAKQGGAWFGLRKAEAVRMVPQNLAWDQVCTGDSIRFAIENAAGGSRPLTATAVCVRPDGERQAATVRVLGTHDVLLMPVGLTVPGTYHYTWSLTDPDGAALTTGARDIVLRPFANDRAIARCAMDAMGGSAAAAEQALPLSAAALRREAALLSLEMQALMPAQDAVAGSDAETRQKVLDRTAALVARARHALRAAGTIRKAVDLGPGTSLLAFEGTVWENRGVDKQTPSRAENPLKISRRAVPGEHEPIALGLFNVTDRQLQVRVHTEVADAGPTVTLHRSVCVPTAMGERAWDPLPELDEAGMVSIPSLGSREVWVDVDVGTAAPGEHRIKLRLQAINGAGVLEGPKTAQTVSAPETVVEVTLRVLPFEMAGSGVIRLCTWAAPSGPQVEDLLAHGNNVFVTGHGAPKYDAQGRLVGCDYTGLDAVIERFRGEDVVLLLNGMPGVRGEFGSDSYRKDLATFVNDLVAHMASKGLDTDHFGLYPFDEPGGHGWHAVEKYVAFGKMVRAANPDVMIYMDGGGDLPMYQAMAPYTDIWCPALTMLSERTPVMEVARSTGRMLWSYDCSYAYARPIGPNIKNINIIGQFRTAALFALRYGATGIGYWCYNSGGDPWTRIKDEYPLVYPGRTKPVTSRRWEAVREGIEDFRILTALRERLGATDTARLDQETQDRVRRFLEVGLPALVAPGSYQMSLGLARSTIDASNNDAQLNAFRREMMDCVSAVSGGPAKPGTKGE